MVHIIGDMPGSPPAGDITASKQRLEMPSPDDMAHQVVSPFATAVTTWEMRRLHAPRESLADGTGTRLQLPPSTLKTFLA